MRELKFRAWGIKEKAYLKLCSIHLSTKRVIVSIFGRAGGNISLPFSRVILEQYTGLKDKNGKEIYEGDIVSDEFEYGGEKAKTIWQVRWCDDECAFELHYVSGFEVDDCWLVSDDEENYKVIGNIHENPELLEAKNVD